MADSARDEIVTLRGLRFHYRDYGGHGRPIVLLHGLASNARWWNLVGPLLTDRFRVLALDQRGHGGSDRPDDGYDFVSVVGDLAAFIEELNLDQLIVGGHSWGGNVALEYAATRPEHVGALVLVDGGFLELSGRDGATWERAEREMAPPDLTHLTPKQLIEGAKRWELGRFWSDEVEAALMGNFHVTEAGTIRPYLSHANHMKIVRALWDQRPSELCASVDCPVLFIAAERADEGRAREWIEMKRVAIGQAQERLSDCQVLWFEDTVHDIPLQRPQELAAAIEEFGLALER